MPTNPKTLPIDRRLKIEADLKPLLAAAAAALESYEATYLVHVGQMYPIDTIAALKRQLEKATDAAQISKLQGQIAICQTSSEEGQRSARRIVRNAYPPVSEAVGALVAQSLDIVNGYLAEAEKAEAAFFGEFGLPIRATDVSGRVRSVIQTLQGFKRSLSPSVTTPAVPSYRSSVIEWFRS